MLWSCRYIQCTDLHGCNVSCCRYFLPTSKSTVQGYGLHSTCRWRWWDSTPDYLFPLWLTRYISVLRYLYMWLHFDIYIDVLCVPAYWSRDGTETQRLDRLRSGRYMDALGRLLWSPASNGSMAPFNGCGEIHIHHVWPTSAPARLLAGPRCRVPRGRNLHTIYCSLASSGYSLAWPCPPATTDLCGQRAWPSNPL